MPSFQIEGLDPILAKMKNLGQKMQAKGVRAAGVKAMRIVRDAARAKARTIDRPETPLNIAKNIVTRNNARAGKRIGGVVVQVGVVGGAKKYGNNRKNVQKGRVGKTYLTGGTTFYWRYLEFGTSQMRAQPFMRPALENNVSRVTESFVSNLNTEIDKALT